MEKENKKPDFDKIVEQWFAENILGTPVTTITEAYNVVYLAKEKLKKQLSNLAV